MGSLDCLVGLLVCMYPCTYIYRTHMDIGNRNYLGVLCVINMHTCLGDGAVIICNTYMYTYMFGKMNNNTAIRTCQRHHKKRPLLSDVQPTKTLLLTDVSANKDAAPPNYWLERTSTGEPLYIVNTALHQTLYQLSIFDIKK